MKYQLSFNELLSGNLISSIPIAHQQHLEELLKRVNIVNAAYGKDWLVTSGYRDIQDHMRIYRAKGVPDSKIPMGSQHLLGYAVDIADPDLAITAWLKSPEGEKVLLLADLYCESGNKNWVHFQVLPPKSGHRWFLP